MRLPSRLRQVERLIEAVAPDKEATAGEIEVALEYLARLTHKIRAVGAFFTLTGVPDGYQERLEALLLERVPIARVRARPSPALASARLGSALERGAETCRTFDTGGTFERHNSWMLQSHFAEEVATVAALGAAFDPDRASCRELIAARYGPTFEHLHLHCEPGWRMLDLFYAERVYGGRARYPAPELIAAVEEYLRFHGRAS